MLQAAPERQISLPGQPTSWQRYPRQIGRDARAAMTAESTAVCDQQTAEGAGRGLGEHSGCGARLKAAVAHQKAGGRQCAVRADLPGLRQRHRRCVRPRIPGFSPGGLGPHLTSSGSPAGFPPVSRLPAGFSPFARLPLVSLRPAFSGSSPSAVARVPVPLRFPPGSLPLSNLHDSAAAGRFGRRWSRAARAKVTSPAATLRLDFAVIRSALQMGSGWARCDVATESPVTSGRERRTPPRPNRPDIRRLLAPGQVQHRSHSVSSMPDSASPVPSTAVANWRPLS
jgi:hypothetical protein